VQSLFFDAPSQEWLWNRDEPFGRLFLYKGIKGLLIAFGLVLIATLFITRKSAAVKPYRSGLRILILSLILVPASVSGLKAVSNVACPRDLFEFGGNIPYAGFFRAAPTSKVPIGQQRCFPAGHASGGFALLALPFLFGSARNRKVALCGAMAVGWTMGGYKMLIGDHFLSHTITTMLLAWLIINLVAVADRLIFRPVLLADEGNVPRQGEAAFTKTIAETTV
jgi:membrane-associated PAP2 superfamily phosphatase